MHFFASFEIHNIYYFMFSLVYIHALMHTKNVWISSNFIRILFSKIFRLFEVIRITFFITLNKYEIIYRKILTTLRCRNKFCFSDSLDLYIIFVIRMYSEFFLVTLCEVFFQIICSKYYSMKKSIFYLKLNRCCLRFYNCMINKKA